MTQFNFFCNKGTSHGRNKFGYVITPVDAIGFAFYCINRDIPMDKLSDKEFDKAYLDYKECKEF